MLVRPAAAGIEVFMLRRSRESAFAPDAYVFPGGTLETQDLDERTAVVGLDAARCGAGLVIAALRELFEECGVLFACRPDRTSIIEWDARDPDRERLRSGKVSFARLLDERGWLADARPLHLFSHWITPASESRRYDVHFFVAAMPSGQKPVADAAETHDGIWIAPADALTRAANGELFVLYPTRKHLERLSAFDRVEALLKFARAKPIITILPTGTQEDGFVLPPELEDAW
jgi:8-oxo-dGTP pyrophosphatase MutT (NUDIX family)